MNLNNASPLLQSQMTEFRSEVKKSNSEMKRICLSMTFLNRNFNHTELLSRIESQLESINPLIKKGEKLLREVTVLIPEIRSISDVALGREPDLQMRMDITTNQLCTLQGKVKKTLERALSNKKDLQEYGETLSLEDWSSTSDEVDSSKEDNASRHPCSTLVSKELSYLMKKLMAHYTPLFVSLGVDSNVWGSEKKLSENENSDPALSSLCTQLKDQLDCLNKEKPEDYILPKSVDSEEEKDNKVLEIQNKRTSLIKKRKQAKEDIVKFKAELMSFELFADYYRVGKDYFKVCFLKENKDLISRNFDQKFVELISITEKNQDNKFTLLSKISERMDKGVESFKAKIAEAEKIFTDLRHRTDVLLGEESFVTSVMRGTRRRTVGSDSKVDNPEAPVTFSFLGNKAPKSIKDLSVLDAMTLVVDQLSEGKESSNSSSEKVVAPVVPRLLHSTILGPQEKKKLMSKR